MENEGGSGSEISHFERTVFYNEIMTGSLIEGEFNFSIFSIMFLQDTGFYRVLNMKADPMIWGKGQGCDFLENNCKQPDKYPEFCEVNNEADKKIKKCSINHTGIGRCNSGDNLADGCQYIRLYSNGDCRMKANY